MSVKFICTSFLHKATYSRNIKELVWNDFRLTSFLCRPAPCPPLLEEVRVYCFVNVGLCVGLSVGKRDSSVDYIETIYHSIWFSQVDWSWLVDYPYWFYVDSRSYVFKDIEWQERAHICRLTFLVFLNTAFKRFIFKLY